MRTLLIASIAVLGFAATAQAQHAGQKSKQLTSSKAAVSVAKRSNLGGLQRRSRPPDMGDRRVATNLKVRRFRLGAIL